VASILCILYDDPPDGHPTGYARNRIPEIQLYPDGQTIPSPTATDFSPGALLGDLSGALGLRRFLAARGHTFITTSDRDGRDGAFDQALHEAEIIIIQACRPASLHAGRIAGAANLRLVITAGSGSDHIDLEAAAHRGITVAEITQSDSVSAAEHAVMLVLSLVRNAGPAASPNTTAPQPIAERARRAYDLEGMQVGSVGAGRTGFAFLRRLRPFDVRLHYTDPRRLPALVESELGLTYHPSVAAMASVCDVVSIHAPLNAGAAALFDTAMIGRMQRGAYLVNTAAQGICDPSAVAHALQTGQLAGYATDADNPPPACGMPARAAGATLSAQARYAAGTREVLECWFGGLPIRTEYLIIDRGRPTRAGARSYGIAGPHKGAPRGRSVRPQ
jgi:formate dehydrogenase